MVAQKFQIHSVKTTTNTFVSQKIESVQFYSFSQAKLSPRFLSLSHRQTGIAHSSRTAFSEDIFSRIGRGGEDYVVEKITKINNGYWSQVLINFINFATFKVLVYVFVMQ